MGCYLMKTINIVQTQNYNLDHWKMSTDHKKISTEKYQQNFNSSQWLMLCWYFVNIKILKFYTMLILYWKYIEVVLGSFWVCTIYKFIF